MSALSEITGRIERLDDAAEKVRGLRFELTDRLERLAHEWDRRYPQRAGEPNFGHRLACTRCTFRYEMVRNDEVLFGTECTYCGKDGGAGVRIPVAWFERQLQKSEVG